MTVEYRDGKPIRVDYVVIAAQHTADVVTRDGKFMTGKLKSEIISKVVRPTLGELVDEKDQVHCERDGKFLVAGPQADSGLTGRKIIVDTYGGWALHGGGAFSGKDATKVDRSAGIYGALYREKHCRLRIADECLCATRLLHRLGRPVSVMVNTYGTGQRIPILSWRPLYEGCFLYRRRE